jgi:hypothetical protein
MAKTESEAVNRTKYYIENSVALSMSCKIPHQKQLSG